MTVTTGAQTIEDRLDALSAAIGFLTEEAEEQRSVRRRWQELSADAMPILSDALERTASGLEAHGDYVAFAKAGVSVVDQVVANFTEEDVRRLGENVVLILNVVKDMTQPEILAVVRRMLDAIEVRRAAIADEPPEPPTLWQLARQLREPEVRRGLGRALDTLGAVTAADPPKGQQETGGTRCQAP